MAVPIPQDYRDLIDDPVVVTLVTIMPDGQPQATPVWIDFDGTYLLVNTARGRQKDKNMQPGAKVTVLAIDPKDPYRYLEIRGVVTEETEEGAIAHISLLAKKYWGIDDYYSRNPEQRGVQQRVIYKIEPRRVLTH